MGKVSLGMIGFVGAACMRGAAASTILVVCWMRLSLDRRVGITPFHILSLLTFLSESADMRKYSIRLLDCKEYYNIIAIL